jgi:ubiquinone/menaquinone biosynthesis C-methylase UbiE
MQHVGRVYARPVQAEERPEEIVRRGYDAIALRYLMWRGYDATTERYVDRVVRSLPTPSRVLDLGCGAGVPVTSRLAEVAGCRVIGVDISARQLWLARQHVPTAAFVQADLTRLAFRPDSFDAVTAVLAFNHVPRDRFEGVLARINVWLRRGGSLVASMGAVDDPDNVEADWLGAPMFFSSFDAEANLALLSKVGFVQVEGEVLTEDEDGRPVSFLWATARRPE